MGWVLELHNKSAGVVHAAVGYNLAGQHSLDLFFILQSIITTYMLIWLNLMLHKYSGCKNVEWLSEENVLRNGKY